MYACLANHLERLLIQAKAPLSSSSSMHNWLARCRERPTLRTALSPSATFALVPSRLLSSLFVTVVFVDSIVVTACILVSSLQPTIDTSSNYSYNTMQSATLLVLRSISALTRLLSRFSVTLVETDPQNPLLSLLLELLVASSVG